MRNICFLILILISYQVNAAEVVDLTGRGGRQESIEFLDGEMVASGFSSAGARFVYQDSGGLGVWSGKQSEEKEIDGRGPNETLRLTFENEVELRRVWFTRTQANDDARILVNGRELFRGDISGIKTKTFSSRNRGTVFEFTISEDNDDFIVGRIEIEHLERQ